MARADSPARSIGAADALKYQRDQGRRGLLMPLLDHFHPPLSKQRHWDSFHGAWAEAIARHLNEELLPEHYYAEARVKIGSRVEIDVATLDTANGRVGNGDMAVWAPPQPAFTAALDFASLDLFEVNVLNDEEGPKVVAAIELVSPANKDRAAHRHAFAVKCASYLQDAISLVVIDVVTERRGNLHVELLDILKVPAPAGKAAAADLYANAYKPLLAAEEGRLGVWMERLEIAAPLPTLPLWLSVDFALPLNLEATYLAACSARRIDLP
jgi:hypothetical protein